MAVSAVLLSGCGHLRFGAPEGSTLSPAQAQQALDALGTLEVKGRASKQGYSRAKFGDGWKDTDHNGCDTRNDILSRDMLRTSYVRGSSCKISRGTLQDPYTGQTIAFTRGADSSADVQIDHIVPLSDAWQTGAQQWDDVTRVRFANDPQELLAVSGPANSAKSDGDAATWLPNNKAFWCEYGARQVSVKKKYRLWVTPAERDALTRIITPCLKQS